MRLPWPRTATAPFSEGRIRSRAEDFVVDEILPIVPSGEGEHLWLKLRKRGHNTRDLAAWLAKQAGVRTRDVGYAGLKDRQAVTVQWFSIWLAGGRDPDLADLPEGVEVLDRSRHTRKLRQGAGRGNRFQLLVRELSGDWAAGQRCLERIGRHGVPNYFGGQRFGFGLANVDRARALFLSGRRVRRASLDGIYVSAARSWIFNEVLAQRIRQGVWDRTMAGDVMALDSTARWFQLPEVGDPEIAQRLELLDVHPSGPLWGRGPLPSHGLARDLEQEIGGHHAELCHGLEAAGLKQDRRALRLAVRDLSWDLRPEHGELELAFSLSSGGYATAVLRELILPVGAEVSPGSA